MRDRVDTLEFELGKAQSEIASLRVSESKVKDDLLYAQSQSMRNNVIFGNIDEVKDETHVQSEAAVRKFCTDKLKIAGDIVSSLKFERVHRVGKQNFGHYTTTTTDKAAPRKIVAKFCFYKDRDMVLKQREQLKDTDLFMHEQYPPEIAKRRRALVPDLKKAKKAGKQAWISYDTLFVNGHPVASGASNHGD